MYYYIIKTDSGEEVAKSGLYSCYDTCLFDADYITTDLINHTYDDENDKFFGCCYDFEIINTETKKAE